MRRTAVGVRTDGPPTPHSRRGCGGGRLGGGPTPPQRCWPRLFRAGIVGLCGGYPSGGPGRGQMHGTVPATEEWLQVTAQNVPVGMSCSWAHGEQAAPAVLVRGVPIPLVATFRQVGVDVPIRGSRVTEPLMSRRPEAGRSALRRLLNLSTYECRERP